MKVGDLVRTKNDPDTWIGHGVVLSISSSRAKVHWFDEWVDDNGPVEFSRLETLEVLSESV